MKKSLLVVVLITGLNFFCQAQYNFSTFTSAYTELSGATPVQLDESPWDDPAYLLELGFDFTLGNDQFTELAQLGLGATIGNTTTSTVSFLGYFSDIADGANVNGAAPSIISYVISGSTGNQIFKVQYANCAFYEEVFSMEPSAENRTNFQIWFYEADNSIEVRFGASTITDAELVYGGVSGPSIGIIIGLNFEQTAAEYAYGLTGNPQNPTFGEVTLDEQNFGLSGTPESGRVYRFTPSGVSGIDDANKASFSVFPTIATTEITLVKESNENSNYTIFDMTGRVVAQGQVNNGGRINIESLATGTYLVRLNSENGTAKIIKQ